MRSGRREAWWEFFLDHLAHSIQIDRLMAGIEHATIQVIKQEPPGVGPGSGPARRLRRRYGQ